MTNWENVTDRLKDAMAWVFIAYLLGALGYNFLGPRVSTDEALCMGRRGGGFARAALWPMDLYLLLYHTESCLTPGYPVKITWW